uniref:Uncharacterized protein n=1 Tax=Triticum urartu TaxID=4572 RepID=A0A8R7PEV8_TRIUA
MLYVKPQNVVMAFEEYDFLECLSQIGLSYYKKEGASVDISIKSRRHCNFRRHVQCRCRVRRRKKNIRRAVQCRLRRLHERCQRRPIELSWRPNKFGSWTCHQ